MQCGRANAPLHAFAVAGCCDRRANNAMNNTDRPRIVRRPLHGVLLLDKPYGLSSNDALQRAKWLLRAEKAGHTGTLDPLATGVLPICLGAATKFSQLHLDADKRYTAVARLGQTTTTGDAEGAVTRECAVLPDALTADSLSALTLRFKGPQTQTPPMHSALKVGGQPLYELARKGIEVERQPRDIVIHDLFVTLPQCDIEYPAIEIDVFCSKGTYIRTLGEDMGKALGCGGHLVSLRRTRTGPFALADTVTLEQLEATPEVERHRLLKPVECLVPHAGTVTLDAADAARFMTGLRRRGRWADAELVAVWADSPRALLGTASVVAGELIPRRLLSPVEVNQMLAAQEAAVHSF
jgi:tRNA pseudouridine55 synthase